MFTEDITALFGDFGVLATYGSLTALVLFDMPDQAVLGDMQLSTDYAMTYPATAFTALKHGDGVTINSVAYTVREITRLDDGALKRAALKR
jgi:hypothetical protein